MRLEFVMCRSPTDAFWSQAGREAPHGWAVSLPRMNVSIMQPYLFPYIGYFQLMASADVFVVHDDVQYIRGGWINRNRLLSGGEPRWVTLPVAAGAHRLNINQRGYAPGAEGPRQFLRRLEAGYRAAPNFAEVFELVRALLLHEDRNVAAFNTHALRGVAESVGITTPLVVSSEMTKDDSLRGEARVIAICEALGAERYVNPIGGPRCTTTLASPSTGSSWPSSSRSRVPTGSSDQSACPACRSSTS